MSKAPLQSRPSKMGPEGGPEADANGKPKMLKQKRIRARNANKVRVKLPPIESYQKELEFTADGPGRVVVRLERLMGSDRIRLTDTKYMATLLERLEEQERQAWTKRRIDRIKKERIRFRQLAIDGLMEPGPDMQDLYFHPVFRVNRILNRLAKMDHKLTPVPTSKLPPIVPVDPFLNDDNGREFKNYPGHAPVQEDELSELSPSLFDLYAELQGVVPSGSQMSRSVMFNDEYEGEGQDEYDKNGELIGIRSSQRLNRVHSHRVKSTRASEVDASSLSDMQKEYGVPPVNLREEWEPFRSHLVDTVYHEDGNKVRELYDLAEDVLGVYGREQETADDFVLKLNRLL